MLEASSWWWYGSTWRILSLLTQYNIYIYIYIYIYGIRMESGDDDEGEGNYFGGGTWERQCPLWEG